MSNTKTTTSNPLPAPPIVDPNQEIGEHNAPDPRTVVQYTPAQVALAHQRAANVFGRPELELWLKNFPSHPEYPLYMEWEGDGRRKPSRATLLDSLVPSYGEDCRRLLSRVQAQGFTLVPYFSFRSVYSQARLWAQAQNIATLKNEVRNIHFDGAPYIAAVLANHAEYCMSGRPVTAALPGNSWHNWGLAIDSYVWHMNKVSWSAKHPGYRAYATIARDELGMNAGFFWTNKVDAVHVQGPQQSSPRTGNLIDWPTIDICMWSLDTAVRRSNA